MVDTLWEKIIATEVEHQQMQIDYFTKREKVGPTLTPQVYQPAAAPTYC